MGFRRTGNRETPLGPLQAVLVAFAPAVAASERAETQYTPEFREYARAFDEAMRRRRRPSVQSSSRSGSAPWTSGTRGVEVRPPAQRTSPRLAARKEKAGEEEDDNKEVIDERIDQAIEQFAEVVDRISGQSPCVVSAVHTSRTSSGPYLPTLCPCPTP
jgi:hypothetical protein